MGFDSGTTSMGDAALERFALDLRERAIADARRRRLRLAGNAADLRDHVNELVEREAPALSSSIRNSLVERVITASVGFGPLEPLLSDSTIDEVMINGHRSIWVERDGALEQTDVGFESADQLAELIERIIAPLGRRVDESSPICDARLPDGSRINIVIPPLALGGPVVTIRRFRHALLGPEDLVANGTISRRGYEYLERAVNNRHSIVVSGGTGSGKTTTLNAISAFVPAGERIVTIEDAAELRLRQGHVVRLEARPANIEGRGAVPIRALVKTALRMRPDRIVVGEVRGGEALDMLAAMTTGHDGGLTTVHANSPDGALERIQTLAMMAGVDVPHVAIRRMTMSAVDIVVHQRRTRRGGREVSAIAEVRGPLDRATLQSVMERDLDGSEEWSTDRESAISEHLTGAS